jgi:hypothetical protein
MKWDWLRRIVAVLGFIGGCSLIWLSIVMLGDVVRLLPWHYWAPEIAVLTMLLGVWYVNLAQEVWKKAKRRERDGS